MCKHALHEVATPLQLNLDDWMWGEPPSDNDDKYQEYLRLLRSFTRMAWQSHDCCFCKEGISAGEWYWCEIWVSKEAGKKKKFYVVKKHDPVCPEELRDLEEEMMRRDEREERKARGTDRKAA